MRLLSVIDRVRLGHLLRRVLDESEFLSDYGVRSLSRRHLEQPYRFGVGGEEYEVRYLPGLSDNRVFGGNSNWRGPIWFPMNFLLIQSIDAFARYYGDSFTIECPNASERQLTLHEIADELARRLPASFCEMMRTADVGRCWATTSTFSGMSTGATTFHSTNSSTATQEPALARVTKPVGRRSSPCCCSTAAACALSVRRPTTRQSVALTPRCEIVAARSESR
jgi:hypothetical protein